ncbi:protein sel-1 homolog 1-like [Rhopilema esculentum]|uniref:protein sel-1 homolog 1-like n=1 Tax=Rhopilema esculentum TaxID=499914 RepID=UPI0031E1BCA0|eukprot:gene2844-1078_t
MNEILSADNRTVVCKSCQCCIKRRTVDEWITPFKSCSLVQKQNKLPKKLLADFSIMSLTIVITILIFTSQTVSANEIESGDTRDNSESIDFSSENVVEQKVESSTGADKEVENVINENVIKDNNIEASNLQDNTNQGTARVNSPIEQDEDTTSNEALHSDKSFTEPTYNIDNKNQQSSEKDSLMDSDADQIPGDVPLSDSSFDEHQDVTEKSNQPAAQEELPTENEAVRTLIPDSHLGGNVQTQEVSDESAANRQENGKEEGTDYFKDVDSIKESLYTPGMYSDQSMTHDSEKESHTSGMEQSHKEDQSNLDDLNLHDTDIESTPENAGEPTVASLDKGSGVDYTSKTESDVAIETEKSVSGENEEQERKDQEHIQSDTQMSPDKPNEMEKEQSQSFGNIVTDSVNENDEHSNIHPAAGNKKKETVESTVQKESVEPGSDLVQEAELLLNQTRKNSKRAYKLIAQAADMNNTIAMEKAAIEYLLGDHLPRNFTKANEVFQKLADNGAPVGQQGLAFMFGTGTGINSSQAKALIYTTFAALGGGVIAEMMLGYRYWGGIGVVQNCESALTHYKKVSQKVAQDVQPMGSPAVHRIRLYDELEQGSAGGNLDDDLLQYYQFLADKGDVQAQVGLGQLYFQGARGVNVDHQKAFQYFKQAADAGNANAQAYLGKMFLEGNDVVPQDNMTAFEYFTKAVEQGNPIGHSGLGLIYLRGKGVTKDYAKAVAHFNLAAEQGWPEAQLQLGNIYYHGHGVNRDYQKAVKYFTLASQSGNVLAVYNLASMHASGNGVLRSCHTATELFKSVAERGRWSGWFTEAYAAYKAGDIDTALIKYYMLAELGYEAAQSNVAYIFDKGESTLYPKNETYARALLQWNRAASQGYTVARVKVGDYHFYGLGTEIDYEVAALHYRLASEQQNNAQAMFNLGYMHEQGLGLKKDIHLAKRFYDMAAESNPDAQVPVALAMVKLGAYFTLDWAKQNYKFWERFNIKELLGKDWDLYIITGLAIALGLLLLIRRTQA